MIPVGAVCRPSNHLHTFVLINPVVRCLLQCSNLPKQTNKQTALPTFISSELHLNSESVEELFMFSFLSQLISHIEQVNMFVLPITHS